jgi:sigma-54 dependent transcriptional regulator, acetoin dehydrogenase operon transcriptional activator AcoR
MRKTMVEKRHLILFLGEGNNSLPLMAQSYARQLPGRSLDLIGASMTPPTCNPLTHQVMKELGHDLDDLSLHSLIDIELFMFDLVVTLGDFDQSCRPNLPGMPPHLHWDVPDPRHDLPVSQQLDQLRQAAALIRQNVDVLLDSHMLDALSVTRRNLEMILDNMPDGVMAHTSRRRIFFFSKAAEKITGYRRKDVLGKDCHEVFPGRFCGGECSYCEGIHHSRDEGVQETEVPFIRQDGSRRILRMSCLPMTESGRNLGALISFKDNTELSLLKGRLRHHHSLDSLIGKDPKMLELFDHIREVSSVCLPVLIEGDSGTGKELVANAIHNIGPRADKPFVAVNCGALPESILESELFGHVRGAFSGAVQNRKGRFELANGGTLFLDEVGELSLAMQVKLLRVLQEQKFERVGGEQTIKVDVRIISATNQNLHQLMAAKRFRRDLYYRLCVVPITLPPLNQRRLDIPALVDHFLERTAKELNRPVLVPSNEVLDVLTRYNWPGNVREVRNAIEYAYVKCHTGMIKTEHLPPEILRHDEQRGARPGPTVKHNKEQVLLALEKTGGDRKAAAKQLGIGRATLYRYLSLYNLK